MRHHLLTLALLAPLAASGCHGPGPLQGPGAPHGRLVLPAAAGPAPAAFAPRPAGPADVAGASLAVRLETSPRALLALPASWDTATLRLSHPTALASARTATLAKGTGIVPNGAGGFVASTPFAGALRPAAGYALTVELWDGGTTTGTVVARKTVAVSLAAGANAIAVALDLVGGPLAGGSGQVSASASTQAQPGIAAGTTDALVAWVDDRAVVKTDVVARRAAADGTYPGADVTVTGAGSLAQAAPQLVHDPGRSRFLAVWEDGASPDLVGQVVGADGTPVGAPLAVAAAANNQQAPRGTFFAPLDCWFFVWADNRGASYDVLGQAVRGSDGTLWGANATYANGGGDQLEPDCASGDLTNRVLIVWRDANTTRIRGRFYDSAGALGPTFDVSADASVAHSQPTVAADPTTGDFVVAWVSGASPPEVRARKVASASSLGPVTVVDAAGQAKALPRLTWVPWLARFLVVWQVDVDATAATDHDVYGRYLTAAGATAGASFAIATGAGHQTRPQAAALTSGQRTVVAYANEAADGAKRVFTQRLN